MEERYQRNVGALTPQEMELLRKKHVCIVGCGGLGGYILEELLRVGVGRITVIDGDRFVPSNLNRQILCTRETIGCSKVEAAALRGEKVNPDVQVRGMDTFLTKENALECLQGADVAVDALDEAEARLVLAEACDTLKIPLVHGAIGGWYAQTAVILPGSRLMEKLYTQKDQAPNKSSLSFGPAICASVQAMETIKLLIGKESVLAGKLLFMDFLQQEYEILSLE